MIRLMVGAALIGTMLAIVGPVRGSDAMESLTVSFDTSKCAGAPGSTAAGLRSPITAVVYSLSRDARFQSVLSVGSGRGPFPATFEVAPDAYYIYGFQGAVPCRAGAGIVGIVLPGHPAFVKVELTPFIADAAAFSYVAGLVAPGLDVRIMQSPATIACDSFVDEKTLQEPKTADPLSRDGNAYYAGIMDMVNGTLVLEITGGGRDAFVRLVLQPNGDISTSSTYKRFDVDTALFVQASANPGKLFCPKTDI